jgi:preprotein translocase subunit SecE
MARKRRPDDDHDPIHRENIPGELEHASGQIDEFDAEIVRGGEGEPIDPASEAELTRQAAAAAPSGVTLKDGAAKSGGGLSRFPNFLRASWAELQRVQWPDRRQVVQATTVVLGFVVVAGGFLGLADVAASKFVDLIL